MSLPDGRHFKVAEFACHDGTPYPEEWADQWARLIELCDFIRDEWGSAIEVVSGYRTEAHNAELAANSAAHQVASGSQHVLGNAADLRPLAGGDASALHRLIFDAYSNGRLRNLGGLGLYPTSNWVHVDTRQNDDGHLSRWLGT